jgi:hypothetical protein
MTEIPVHCANDKLEDVEKLVAHPKNPNKHPKKQVEMLAKIIRAQGWRSPVVVSKRSGYVVAGHGRIEAAKLLGEDKVPVNVQEFETEAEEYAHLMADNKIAEYAELQTDKIGELLEDLKKVDFDLDLTGFGTSEINKALESKQEDIEPEVEFSEVLGESNNYVVLAFKTDIDWLQAQMHFDLKSVHSKRANGKPWSCGIGRVIDGAAYLSKVTGRDNTQS